MFGQRIRVFVIERDIYARQAIVSYLSWDRRTRVVDKTGTPHEMLAKIKETPGLARLDAIVLDTSLARHPRDLARLIAMIQQHLSHVAIICLAHENDVEMSLSAERSGARAYLVRDEVGIGLASAVRFALLHHFTVTQDVFRILQQTPERIKESVTLLPERRTYPRLTERIEQALWLCVVEGLPAERAAEEMSVSTSTVRSYIKEGYRILEAEDETIYPPQISPAERAFLRYSALELDGANIMQQPAA